MKKTAIKCSVSKKDRQYNDQKKRDRKKTMGDKLLNRKLMIEQHALH